MTSEAEHYLHSDFINHIYANTGIPLSDIPLANETISICMLKAYSFNCFLVSLIASFAVAFAQPVQQPKSRDALVQEAIAQLDSNDNKVAAQAAMRLGQYQATEAVPKLLQVLQSSRLLQTSEHVIANDSGSLSHWVSTNVRAAIVTALGLIGDERAVPVLKKYLKRPVNNQGVATENVAHALYLITGKTYRYKDDDGAEKLYEPSPLEEEAFRKRTRPDLKATAGLIASLEIEAHDPSGTSWTSNRPLHISLVITNQSNRAIEIDTSRNNFEFSSVAGDGKRRVTSASLLPAPEPRDVSATVLAPGQKLKLTWIVELKDSPLAREWSGYVNIKCVYTNPRKNRQGNTWRGEQLISNSVERYYYPVEK